MQPMDKFHIRVATQLAKRGSGFDAAEECGPELAKERLAGNRHELVACSLLG
jgi:hypothetical protein